MPNVVKVSLKLSNVVIFFFRILSVQDVTLIWHVGDAAGVEYQIRCWIQSQWTCWASNALESVYNLLFAGVEVGYFADSLEFLHSLSSFYSFYLITFGQCWVQGVSLFRISFSCLSKNLSDSMYFDTWVISIADAWGWCGWLSCLTHTL